MILGGHRPRDSLCYVAAAVGMLHCGQMPNTSNEWVTSVNPCCVARCAHQLSTAAAITGFEAPHWRQMRWW